MGSSAVTLSGAGLLSTTINSTGAANVLGNFGDEATSKTLTINATTGLTLGTVGNSAARTGITIAATGNVVTGAVTSSAATTVAISGTGNVTTDLNAVVAPAITVSGSGAVILGTLNDFVSTVTSTQTAGSLTATLGSLVTQKIVSGAGNDVISTPALVLTTGSVDGGAGTDTLNISTNVGNVNTALLAAKFTNFETLRVNGTLDVSLLSGITAIELSGATNAITNLTATEAAHVTARADIGATTLALTTATGVSDVLTVDFGIGTTTNAATNSTTLTVTGFETVNIHANPGPTATTAAALLTTISGFGTPTTLSSVVMTGSAVALSNAATSVAATYDASALTGDSNATIGTSAALIKGLTLGGNLVVGSTVTGSNYIDTITLGAPGSTYNLGLGNDAISSTYANLHTGAVYNTVDGGAGTDTLTISDGVALSMVDADFKGLINLEKITVTSTTTAAQSIVTGGFFDSNFKGAGVTLTTTSTTGNIVIDESTFSGANKVTATSSTGLITISGGSGNQTISATSVGAAAGEGTQSITTLGGNDTVTSVSALLNTTTNVISTGAGNDTVVGGLGKDQITGGTGADTLTGGGAADTFVFAAGDTGTPTITNFDIITDYTKTAGVNFDFIKAGTLVLGTQVGTAAAGVATITTGLATFNAVDTTFAQHIIAAEAALHLNAGSPASGATVVWQEGLNSYVFISDAVAGVGANDVLIQLTGVTAGALTVAGNIITAMA